MTANGRIELSIDNGIILIGSDLHAWPGPPSTGLRAFLLFCNILKPSIIILNGDVVDGATVSRHPPIGWERVPPLIEEIRVAQRALTEIETISPKANKIWTLGNHDIRLDTKLSTVAPEFKGLHGTKLSDHFPKWNHCWSVHINNSMVVKHRMLGGQNATAANTLNSGKSVVTGHLHRLQVSPFTDYTGTRFGIDSGLLADPNGPQFAYLEDGPRNWRAGFVVLTYRESKLMWPELVHVLDRNHVEFRGEVINV